MIKMSRKFGTVIGICVLILTFGFGTDNSRIKTNVRVQEKILETIIDSDSVYSVVDDIRGLYLEGFGTIYSIPMDYSGFDPLMSYFTGFTFSDDLEVLRFSDRSRARVRFGKPGRSPEAEDEDMQEDIRELTEMREKNRIRMLNVLKEYLRDYGPVQNIGENEAVLLRVVFNEWELLDGDMSEYEISVTGRNLNRLQRGKLNEEAFMNSIIVSMVDETDRTHKDISIMRNILNTALDRDGEQEWALMWQGAGDSWETYVPGTGAIFYSTWEDPLNIFGIDRFAENMASIYLSEARLYGEMEDLEDLEELEELKEMEESKRDSDLKDDEQSELNLEDVKNELVELLATYGPTLKSVQADEQIIVAVKTSDRYDDEKDNGFILRLKMEDIRKSGGSFEKLKEHVSVSEL